MVIGLSIHTFTIVHVVISLAAIASGLIVLFGMLGASATDIDRIANVKIPICIYIVGPDVT